jgi:hypothetical protein
LRDANIRPEIEAEKLIERAGEEDDRGRQHEDPGGTIHRLSTRQFAAGSARTDSIVAATRSGVMDVMHSFKLQRAKVLPS